MEIENSWKKSSGVAKAGLALGIVGTGLATMSAITSGAGLFGNNNTRTAEKISAMQSEITEGRATRYTDQMGAQVYQTIIEEDNKLTNVQQQLYAAIVENDKQAALNAQAMEMHRDYDNMVRDYQFALMDAKINALNTELTNQINCNYEKQTMITNFNQQLSQLSDASIISYVNSNFYPGRMFIPASAISPSVVTQ